MTAASFEAALDASFEAAVDDSCVAPASTCTCLLPRSCHLPLHATCLVAVSTFPLFEVGLQALRRHLDCRR